MTGTRLPDNWQPSEGDVLYGIGLGFVTSQVHDIAEDLRLWAAANGNRQIARKLCWSAAFKSWMRREAAKRGKIHGAGNATMEAFDRLIEHAEMGEGGSQGPVLNLTASSSGVGETTDRPVAPCEPTEPGSLFTFHRKNP